MRKTAIAVCAAIALGGIALVAVGLLMGPPAVRWARDRGGAFAEVEPAPAAHDGAAGLRSTVRMKRPRPKRCLTPEEVDLGGDEMAMARLGDGLDGQQISSAIQPFHSYLASCQPVDGDDHSGTAVFGIEVGCDGVVKGVDLVDDELYEPDMIECLTGRLAYVEFPAHDLADGMYFEYPLIFHPPG